MSSHDIKKKLLEMINRPESFDPASILEDEKAQDGQSVENPEDENSVAGQIRAGEEVDLEAKQPKAKLDQSGTIKPDQDTDITKMLRKLKSGGKVEEDEAPAETEQSEDEINSPDASLEQKKKAISKIKEKYLGR